MRAYAPDDGGVSPHLHPLRARVRVVHAERAPSAAGARRSSWSSPPLARTDPSVQACDTPRTWRRRTRWRAAERATARAAARPGEEGDAGGALGRAAGAFFKLPAPRMAKTLLYKGFDDRTEIVAVMMRGDHEVNEVKLTNALATGEGGAPTRRRSGRDRRRGRLRRTGRPAGRAGTPIVRRQDPRRSTAAPTRVPRPGTCGSRAATRTSSVRDLRGGAPGATPARVRQARCDIDARHRGRPHLQARHEVLGRDAVRRSPTRTATSPRRSWAATASASARTLPAAIEQNHDADGIVWPCASRRSRRWSSLNRPTSAPRRHAAEKLYEARRSAGSTSSRRPRRAAGRQVQGRRPARLPDPRQRGRPGPEGRKGRDRHAGRDKQVRAVPVAEALSAVKAVRAERHAKRRNSKRHHEEDHPRGRSRVPLARPQGQDRGRPDQAVPDPGGPLARLHPGVAEPCLEIENDPDGLRVHRQGQPGRRRSPTAPPSSDSATSARSPASR